MTAALVHPVKSEPIIDGCWTRREVLDSRAAGPLLTEPAAPASCATPSRANYTAKRCQCPGCRAAAAAYQRRWRQRSGPA